MKNLGIKIGSVGIILIINGCTFPSSNLSTNVLTKNNCPQESFELEGKKWKTTACEHDKTKCCLKEKKEEQKPTTNIKCGTIVRAEKKFFQTFPCEHNKTKCCLNLPVGE